MKEHLRYLDGLRALAVCMVVSAHAYIHTNPGAAVPYRYMSHGKHGVDLFFVLSGCCLAYPYLRAYREFGAFEFSWMGYFTKRVVRVVPPYYVCIAILTMLTILPNSPIAQVANVHAILTSAFHALTFADNDPMLLNGSFWTLAIEMRWYIVFPLFLGLYVRSRRAFLLAFLLVCSYLPMTRLQSPDVDLLPMFLAGIVAADCLLTRPNWTKFAWIGTIAIAAVQVYFSTPTQPTGYVYAPLWGLAAFCLVVSCGRVLALQAFFELPFVRGIGIASYSIYLVHEPILVYLEQVRGMKLIPAVALALAGGCLFWFLIERFFTSAPIRLALANALQRGFSEAPETRSPKVLRTQRSRPT